MTINNNTFIDILGLPEWDEIVLDVLDILELERPILKEGEVDKFLNSEKYGVELFFDNIEITELQKKLASTNTLFLDHVSFDQNTTLPMPFGIKMGNGYNEIVKKVGREPDTPKVYREADCGWGDYQKPYWLQCNFEDENMLSLRELFMRIQEPYQFD